MLVAQGVSRDVAEKLKEKKFSEVFPQAENQTKIESRVSGLVRDVRLDILEGVLVNKMGGYNASGAGFQIHVDIGKRVNEGTCLATVYHEGVLTGKTKNELYRAFEVERIQFQRIMRTFRNENAGGAPKNKNTKNRKKRNSKSKTETTDKEEEGEEVKATAEEAPVSSSVSSESVPKDYVVVVSTGNDNERKVSEKTEE